MKPQTIDELATAIAIHVVPDYWRDRPKAEAIKDLLIKFAEAIEQDAFARAPKEIMV